MLSTAGTMLNRREALIKPLRLGGVTAGAAGLGLWLSERSRRPEPELAINLKRSHAVSVDPNLPEMAVIQGDNPEQLARTAIEELGGIRRFVSRAEIVLVKPNIGWDRTPEQAADTNPRIIAEIVRQCWNAGAKRVAKQITSSLRCLVPKTTATARVADVLHRQAEVVLASSDSRKSLSRLYSRRRELSVSVITNSLTLDRL